MVETVALQLASGEQNPYLLGLFAPVRDEITADDLEVIGQIPRDLNGVYLRNGPNRRYAARGRYHWFDGDGMVHAWRSRTAGRYRTATWQAPPANGGARRVDRRHGEPRNPAPPAACLRQRERTSSTDGKVYYLACRQPMSLDPLPWERHTGAETFGTRDDVMATPEADERTGGCGSTTAPATRCCAAGVAGSRAWARDIASRPAAAHMAITENWSVLMDLPLVQTPGRPLAITFDPSTPTTSPLFAGARCAGSPPSPCTSTTSSTREDGTAIVMDVCPRRRSGNPRRTS